MPLGKRRLFDEPRSPGEAIKTALQERGWSQEEFAAIAGKSREAISAVINGKSRVTPNMAVRLAAALGDEPGYWMRLDASYQLALLDHDAPEVERRARVFTMAPIREMQRRGWISQTKDLERLERELRSFFQIKSLEEEPRLIVATRKASQKKLTPAERAWCFRARQMAEAIPMSRPFDSDRLSGATAELRKLATHAKEARRLARVLEKYGVRFVVVEPLSGAKIDGAAFWLDDLQSPVIAVSIRYNRIDAFWFTVMHEWSHISNGDALSVDTNLVRDPEDIEDQSVLVGDTTEERANDEAADALIPNTELESFVRRLGPLYPRQRIIQFAHRVKIHPGIVVGQLQHRRELGYSSYRGLLVKIRAVVIETSLTDGWGQTVSPAVFER